MVQQGIDAAGVGAQYAKGVRPWLFDLAFSKSEVFINGACCHLDPIMKTLHHHPHPTEGRVLRLVVIPVSSTNPEALIILQALDEVSPYVKTATDTVSPYVKTAVSTVRDVAGPAFRQAQPQLQVLTFDASLCGAAHLQIVVHNKEDTSACAGLRNYPILRQPALPCVPC